MPTTSEVKGVPSFFLKCRVARKAYFAPTNSTGKLQYTMMILPRSEIYHKFPSSSPAITDRTPKGMNTSAPRNPHKINEGTFTADAVCGNLRENDEAHNTSIGEQSIANTDEQCHQTIGAAARCQRGDRRQIQRQLLGFQSFPSCRVCAPQMCHNNDETRQCADHHGIQKNTQRLHHALFTGMFRIRSSGGHGDGPLTCFIGHEPTFYPLCKSCAEETAEYRFRCECAFKYRTKEIRDGANIQKSNEQYRTAVNTAMTGTILSVTAVILWIPPKAKNVVPANEQDTCDTVEHRCP